MALQTDTACTGVRRDSRLWLCRADLVREEDGVGEAGAVHPDQQVGAADDPDLPTAQRPGQSTRRNMFRTAEHARIPEGRLDADPGGADLLPQRQLGEIVGGRHPAGDLLRELDQLRLVRDGVSPPPVCVPWVC